MGWSTRDKIWVKSQVKDVQKVFIPPSSCLWYFLEVLLTISKFTFKFNDVTNNARIDGWLSKKLSLNYTDKESQGKRCELIF